MLYFMTFAALAAFGAYGATVRTLDPSFSRYTKQLLFILFAIGLIAMAGLRAGDIDRDYWNYEGAFTCVVDEYEGCRMEPVFNLISHVANAMGYGTEGVIFIYALLSISLYAILIARSETPYLSLLTYFSMWFFLHEMTQIRAGLALAVTIFGLDYLYEKKRLKFFLACGLASMVHLSCAAFVILAFFNTRKHNPWLGAILIAVSIALSYDTHLVGLFERLFEYLFSVDSKYVYYAMGGEEQSRIGFIRGSFIAIYVACAFGAKRIAPRVPKIYLYLNSMLIGTCLQFILYALPAVPSRMMQLFCSIVIFLLPALVFMFRSLPLRYLAVCGVVAFDALHLFYYIHIDKIVTDYRTIHF